MTKHKLEMTPIMALSVFAIFAMMPILFAISNSSVKTDVSNAQEPTVVISTPTPEPTPGN